MVVDNAIGSVIGGLGQSRLLMNEIFFRDIFELLFSGWCESQHFGLLNLQQFRRSNLPGLGSGLGVGLTHSSLPCRVNPRNPETAPVTSTINAVTFHYFL